MFLLAFFVPQNNLRSINERWNDLVTENNFSLVISKTWYFDTGIPIVLGKLATKIMPFSHDSGSYSLEFGWFSWWSIISSYLDRWTTNFDVLSPIYSNTWSLMYMTLFKNIWSGKKLVELKVNQSFIYLSDYIKKWLFYSLQDTVYKVDNKSHDDYFMFISLVVFSWVAYNKTNLPPIYSNSKRFALVTKNFTECPEMRHDYTSIFQLLRAKA